MEVVWDNKVDIYTSTDNEGKTVNRYFKRSSTPQREPHGEPASVVKTEDGALEVKTTGAQSTHKITQSHKHLPNSYKAGVALGCGMGWSCQMTPVG